jgi:alpha-galactosidase
VPITPRHPVESCYARVEDGEVVAGNLLIERRWRAAADGTLAATSLLHKANAREWVVPTAQFEPAAAAPALTTSIEQPSPTGSRALVATVSLGARTWTLHLFPDSAAVTVLVSDAAPAATAAVTTRDRAATGVESTAAPSPAPTNSPDLVDRFRIDPLHKDALAVELVDRTDVHDNLVFERHWLLHTCELSIEHAGNVFAIEDRLTGHGLLMLKYAPLPHARPVRSDRPDFAVTNDGTVSLFDASLAHDGHAYPVATIAYSGGRVGRIAAVQRHQRQYRRFSPGRDGLFLSNTWGDRSRDARINEPFMRAEVAAGQRLGVDVVQIDDGWQAGRTANSAQPGGVWNDYWATRPDFWLPHPERFPNGLQPLIDDARSRGLRFGLWYSPDSSNDFANWRRDADQILSHWRTLGVEFWKMDGIKMHTRAGEANLRRLFEACLRESDGALVFDLDVTAETRPGYFGLVEVGPIFVENRYTDWHRYWPHATLRNFWQLAQYVDPARLRFELLNNTRCPEIYPNDPLAPSLYDPAYLFASVMFSSPLGWFEASNLPQAYVAQVAELAALWKHHRDMALAGTIVPIGQPPDGTAWTGFASVLSGHELYLLALRETNDRPSFEFDLPIACEDRCAVAVLAGHGDVRLGDRTATVTLEKPRSFVLAKIAR